MQAVYILYIKDIARNLEKALSFLDKNSILRAEQFADEEDKLRSLGSSLLIKAFTAPSALKYNEYGKPYKDEKPFFNVSHSGEKIGIFFSDSAEVGFDIQKITSFDDKLLDYVFSAEKPLIKTDRDFAKLWTMKESAIKCLGRGVCMAKDNAITEIKEDNFLFGGQKFYYKSVFLDKYALTLCSEKPVSAEILQIDCEFIIKTLAKKQENII